MQCQSCGTAIKKAGKNCPACGEEISAISTAIIAPQIRTNTLEPSFINELSPALPSGIGAKVKLNGQVNNEKLASALANEKSLANSFASNMINPPPTAMTKETTPPTEVLQFTCRRCNNELKPAAKFCSVCGTTTEPSTLERSLKYIQSISQDGFSLAKTHINQSSLPIATTILVVLASLCLLASFFQYLIPTTVDDPSASPLIYHLRSIEFLLVALVFVVAGSIFNRR